MGDAMLRFAAIVALYAVVRWSPRGWWAWAGALAAVAIVAAGWGPYALAAGPADLPALPPGAARDGVMRLIAEAHLPATQAYVGPQTVAWADVTGRPGLARVTVSAPMLAAWSPAEIRANLAHVASHFRHADQLALAALTGLGVLIGLFAIDRLYAPVARLLRAPADKTDPAGVPAAAIIAIAWWTLAGIGLNAFNQAINVRADAEALATSHEADGLAAGLVKDWNHQAADPNPIEQAVLYSHPPLGQRLRAAMAWKAARARP